MIHSKSMQLIAGRTAQEFNQRKKRQGAFWEDRYHATAIEADTHLIRCLVYIDLNMVRAGAVWHPSQWRQSGYNEILNPPDRKRIIDLHRLLALCNAVSHDVFKKEYLQRIEDPLAVERNERLADLSGSIAIGTRSFVDSVHEQLGVRVRGRSVVKSDESFVLKESYAPYQTHFDSEKGYLSVNNGHYWDVSNVIPAG